MTNGAPQGRILSPVFFNVYMDSLSVDLNNCNMGCVINNCKVNHLFYADDSVLLAPSPTALQEFLNICSEYSNRFELSYS